jgi:AAA15 family ATPase/GTPase
MLVEFRVGNYRSFREEQALSLVASKDTELNDNCVKQGKLCLLKTTGIYGPNASGKSNLIKALSTMRDIIVEPAKPGEKISLTPFKLDNKYSNKPCSFEVTFYYKEVRYQYGFTATSERVYDEWLYAYPKGRLKDTAQNWYERKFNKKTSKTDWKFGPYLRGEKKKLQNRTINNVLLLSVGAQWNNKQLAEVHEWFSDKIQVILPSDRSPVITIQMLMSSDKSEKWRKLYYSYINNMMRRADLGIKEINIEKHEFAPDEIDFKKIKFPPDMPDEFRKKFLRDLKGKVEVEFIHQAKPNGKDVRFSNTEESDGTRRFFELAGPWLLAILEGKTLLVDEIETSLHPHLVSELIKFIQNPKLKRKGTQLIFATHNTTLLDPELFRRDQVWFTQKDEHNSTRLYPLSDYKLRKGEAMQKGYLAGRYGAIPIIEAFELNG